jgi:hypothetical protein
MGGQPNAVLHQFGVTSTSTMRQYNTRYVLTRCKFAARYDCKEAVMCVECKSNQPDSPKISHQDAVQQFKNSFKHPTVFEAFSILTPTQAVAFLEMLDHALCDAVGCPYEDIGVTSRRYGDDPDVYTIAYEFRHFEAEIALVHRNGQPEIIDFAFPKSHDAPSRMIHFEALLQEIMVPESQPRSPRA